MEYRAIGVYGGWKGKSDIVGFSNESECKVFCMVPEQMVTPQKLKEDRECFQRIQGLLAMVGEEDSDIIWKALVKKAYPSVYDDPNAYKHKDKRKPEKMFFPGVTREDSDATWKSRWDHLPPQAKIICEHIIPELPMTISQVEQEMFRIHKEGILETKQNPMRIFLYYLPRLITIGLIRRGINAIKISTE